MSQNLTISETGLKLIKAFEGYRPVDRELISGQRMVGYGHRLYSEDAVVMNKSTAEATLRADLEPFEEMINTQVHAPMSQSQFDALCSFAFNIGPKAFLQSDTLRALNNGRPLDAANGFDIWRKSEIDGKTYVVDALMRRRTAEKALFLRTKRDLPAGREDLPPVADEALSGLTTDDALPIFTKSDANGIVATAPFDAEIAPSRRQEDGPAGALQLSERDIIEDGERVPDDSPDDLPDDLPNVLHEDGVGVDESRVVGFRTPTPNETLSDEAVEPLDLGLDLNLDLDLGLKDEPTAVDPYESQDKTPSPIAAAALDIVARLDALIDDAVSGNNNTRGADEDWPESLITTDDTDINDDYFVRDPAETVEPAPKNVIDWKTKSSPEPEELEKSRTEPEIKTETKTVIKETAPKKDTKPVGVIDELARDDAYRMRTDSAAKYIETTTPAQTDVLRAEQNNFGVWVLVILGFLLVGLAGGAMMSGSKALLGDWGPIIAFTGFVIGIGLILAGIYAKLRMNHRG